MEVERTEAYEAMEQELKETREQLRTYERVIRNFSNISSENYMYRREAQKEDKKIKFYGFIGEKIVTVIIPAMITAIIFTYLMKI